MAGKYDDMSFGKAFAAARKEKGAGKTFTWKGKSYTTNYKEETKKPAKKTAPKSSARPKTKPKGEITSRRLTPVKDQGRGDGRAEADRRRTDSLIAMATKAIEDSEKKSEKRVPGRAIVQAIRNAFTGDGPTNPTGVMREGAKPSTKREKPASTGSRGRNRGRTGAAKGGMMTKKAKK